MTPRPPTLRENRRYILARVLPAGTPIDQKELYFAISDAVTSLWGDGTAALITPAVVAAEGDYVFVRCRRGTERELSIALSTVTGCRETRLALRTLAVSGTMESLRERIRKMEGNPAGPAPAETDPAGSPGNAPQAPAGSPESSGENPQEVPRTYTFKGTEWVEACCNGHKVDVIEKGFKNTHRLFLTREDLEN